MSGNIDEKTKAIVNLIATKALLSDSTRWCKRYLAMDANGLRTEVTDERATRWCALGALEKVTGSRLHLTEWRHLTAAAKELGWQYVSELNNETDHTMVMRMFDMALEKASQS